MSVFLFLNFQQVFICLQKANKTLQLPSVPDPKKTKTFLFVDNWQATSATSPSGRRADDTGRASPTASATRNSSFSDTDLPTTLFDTSSNSEYLPSTSALDSTSSGGGRVTPPLPSLSRAHLDILYTAQSSPSSSTSDIIPLD